MFILFYLTSWCSLSRTHVNIWLRANQRKTRTQNHQNLTTVLLRLSKYWQILHRSATTSLQNAARNVKAENRRETAQSSWVCQVYRRVMLEYSIYFRRLHIVNLPIPKFRSILIHRVPWLLRWSFLIMSLARC